MRWILALFVSATMAAAEPAVVVDQPDPAQDPVAEPGTLIVPMSGNFPVRAGANWMSGPGDESRYDATFRLRRALTDVETTVVLDATDGCDLSMACAEEFAAMINANKTGKHIILLTDGTDDATMILAAACDEVVSLESGILMVDGVAIQMDYYAGALAKIGVRFHAVTSGLAKTAPEPLTRTEPTPAAIAEAEGLLDAIDVLLREAGSRNGRCDIDAARAQAPQIPSVAVATGLVDRTVDFVQFIDELPGEVRWQTVGEEPPDLQSLPGIMAFVEKLIGSGRHAARPAKTVAMCELVGDIVDESTSTPGVTIGTDMVDVIDDLAYDDVVTAVVLRINSPGGSAGCSERIHQAVLRCAAQKPVIAFCDDVVASGGYYIACAAQTIVVHRATIGGSIGVFALLPDLSATQTMLGITRHTITRGPRATIFALEAMTPEKEAALRVIINDVDQRFQSRVAKGRHLDPAIVAELAGGKVYLGDAMVANGLADRIGSLSDAVQAARAAANQADPLPIERFPEAPGLFQQLGLGWLGARQAELMLLPVAWQHWVRAATQNRPAVYMWRAAPTLR